MTRSPARSLLAFVFGAALAAVLAACGGGGGVGGGGTGSFAAGPITGFGSVIVNDIAFDESEAAVEDGDGTGRRAAELRLGMMVEIDADAVVAGSAGSTAKARRIRFDSALQGTVEAVDATGFAILGQRVEIGSQTVFDPALAGGIAAVRAGAEIEVYAEFDAATGRYLATRVEPRNGATAFRIRGFVTAVDAAAQTLRIGSTVFSYAGATGLAGTPTVGQHVRLTLRTTPSGQRWTVVNASNPVRALPDLDSASLKGAITVFTSLASFQVDGRTVDGSTARVEGGLASSLRVGVRVEVEGATRNGVLVARSVRIRNENVPGGGGGNGNAGAFQLRGPIESVDTGGRTFVLRGQTVSYARSDLQLVGGTLADLTTGRTVNLRGQLSADGTRIEALRIVIQ